MVEEHGWAIEPVAAQPDRDPPMAGYVYTIGLSAGVRVSRRSCCSGCTPVGGAWSVRLVADLLRGGTEIPLGSNWPACSTTTCAACSRPIDLADGGAAASTTGRRLAPRRTVRCGAAAVARPQRVPADRTGLRSSPGAGPTGRRRPARSVPCTCRGCGVRSASAASWSRVCLVAVEQQVRRARRHRSGQLPQRSAHSPSGMSSDDPQRDA